MVKYSPHVPYRHLFSFGSIPIFMRLGDRICGTRTYRPAPRTYGATTRTASTSRTYGATTTTDRPTSGTYGATTRTDRPTSGTYGAATGPRPLWGTNGGLLRDRSQDLLLIYPCF